MDRTLKRAMEAKYKAILAQERAWATTVARKVIRPRPISVWEVMIPVLLIFTYAKTKGEKEVIVQNLLFTKELALRAALGMTRNGQSRQEAMIPIEEKTRHLMETVKGGIYSEEIRQKQLKEIHLLIDHYTKLLQAEGKDYDSLVLDAYMEPQAFLSFLARLREAEREVNLAALNTLGDRGSPEFVSMMEEVTQRVRSLVTQRIFKTSRRPEYAE